MSRFVLSAPFEPLTGSVDTTRIVADSVKLGRPIIVVTVNYRLSIFAFGDGKGERNLAVQDLQCAMNWIYSHIDGFGGDKVIGSILTRW